MVRFTLIIGLSLALLYAHAQKPDSLFDMLARKDSIMFQQGFNNCQVEVFDLLIADDLEFYHDQSGITRGKADFIDGIANGLCQLNYKATRELDKETLRVFPLYDNGKLYAALQTGTHRFFAQYDGKEDKELTSVARFDHLWVLKDGQWKLSRVISYDHIAH
jgi:hypothetical protein